MSLNSALWQIPTINLSEDHLVGLQKKLEERLGDISSRFKDVRFATSLAAEDMAVTHGIANNKKSIRVFTLATGRLHAETIEMTNLVESTYGLSIERVEPDQADVEAYISQYGLNGFYDSEEAKKKCCQIRKVKPLELALKGADAWITGQRRSQSVTRLDLPFEELDESRGIPNSIQSLIGVMRTYGLTWSGKKFHYIHCIKKAFQVLAVSLVQELFVPMRI